ncbi:Clp protease family protein [Theileria parva strain Muguga]|uniref:ATP-dependent Clp protease proteolytic subunit n=1 Tax=Theileria parva TaxID=5875 RepID=Q4N319_THEPA|nr:Clp protease family protein [Theileria parva strain Muguga]EAN31520.1 Clp protease family protein [Theileria parva strain Muguga]|eukprot:XP_763803.1 ATP-dependent Clp protease proteolytic subunit [Theileria parva strain Muguga]
MNLNIILLDIILIFVFKKSSFTKRISSHSFYPKSLFINNFSKINYNNLKLYNDSTDNDNQKESYDKAIDEFFIKNRMIFLSGELNDKVSFKIISSILRINENDPNLPIKFYINSPGGSVTAGLAIFDVLRSLKMPVETVSLGQAASMGAFLLASGTKGMRYAMPNSRIMIHQPLGGAHGQASDIEIQANEILQIREILNTNLSRFTGKSVQEIEKDCSRDNYMRPSEALQYGLIDHIIQTQ